MVVAHAHPTFELSDAVPLLAKTAAKERKLGPCPEIPYCPEIPSLTLLLFINFGTETIQLTIES